MKITHRITLLWIVLFGCGLLLFAVIAAINVAHTEQRALDSQLRTAASGMANSVDGRTGRLESKAVNASVPGFGAALLRANTPVQHFGNPLPAAVVSARVPIGIPESVGRNPTYRVLATKVPEWPSERAIVYASQDAVAQAVTRVRQALLIAFFPIIILAAAAGWLLARSSLAPVDRLATTAAQVARTGKLDERFAVLRPDELGRLAQTFNAMLESLQRSFERERAFIGDVSHELRHPLFTIGGEAELALSRDRESAEYRDALAHIALRAGRLSETIDDLLLLARADAEALSARGESEVNEAVSEACASAAHLREEVRVRATLADAPILVAITPQLLRRLVDNIVRNAVVAAAHMVTVEVDAERAAVIVADDGPGIPPERRNDIFRRFVRDESKSGAGLGLAIAAAIAGASGASISVGERAGGGSVFTITFAAVDRSGTPDHAR